MTEKELIQLLSRVKDAPELGGGFDAKMDAACLSRIQADLGFEAETTPRAYGWKEYADFASWEFGSVFARPFAVGAAAFALVFGGWVTTVNASFDSLPGDVLYPIKLVTERMQITFATSGEQRARLHAEFADRRLQEASAISSSDRPDRGVQLKAAVDGFKAELASANEQLTALGSGNPSQAVDLAVTLDRKADEYHAILTQTSPSSASVEEKSEVADAQTAVEQVNTTAIDTLVSASESGDSDSTSVAIQKNFQDKLTDTRSRIALTTARLTALKNALAAAGIKDADLETRIAQTRQQVTSHDTEISQAMDAYAAGGYRSAFDMLNGVSTVLDHAEDTVADIEIDITTKISGDDGPPSSF